MSLRDKPIDLLLELCFHLGNDVVRQASAERTGHLSLHRLMPHVIGIRDRVFDLSSRG